MSNIPRYHRTELIVPRSARGYGTDEFLYFSWDPALEPALLRVLVEDLSGRWINLGTVKKSVFIPNVYFPNQANLVVVGRNRKGEQVRFFGRLRRGQFYILPGSKAGDYIMRRMIPQHIAGLF